MNKCLEEIKSAIIMLKFARQNSISETTLLQNHDFDGAKIMVFCPYSTLNCKHCIPNCINHSHMAIDGNKSLDIKNYLFTKKIHMLKK